MIICKIIRSKIRIKIIIFVEILMPMQKTPIYKTNKNKEKESKKNRFWDNIVTKAYIWSFQESKVPTYSLPLALFKRQCFQTKPDKAERPQRKNISPRL